MQSLIIRKSLLLTISSENLNRNSTWQYSCSLCTQNNCQFFYKIMNKKGFLKIIKTCIIHTYYIYLDFFTYRQRMISFFKFGTAIDFISLNRFWSFKNKKNKKKVAVKTEKGCQNFSWQELVSCYLLLAISKTRFLQKSCM